MTTIDPNKRIQRHRTEEEIRQALSNAIHGKVTMCVPPQIEDTDVILYDAIKELFELREQVQTMIDNLLELQKEQVL
jgi:hypothetical protein